MGYSAINCTWENWIMIVLHASPVDIYTLMDTPPLLYRSFHWYTCVWQCELYVQPHTIL